MFILNCYIAEEIALLESYGLFWNVLYGPLNIFCPTGGAVLEGCGTHK